MPSSTSSVTSFRSSLMTLSLLWASLVLPCHQSKVEIPNPFPKNTFLYDHQKNEFTKSTTQFERVDFRDGEWYFIKGLKILEFHPRFPGFLDFSSGNRSFYKALYLDNFNRVLVFPQESKNKTLIPYVSRSRAFNGTNDVVEIYPKGATPLRECFSDPEVFNLVFPANKQAQIIQGWNRMPFLDPQISGKGTFNSFNNYWGAFIGFKDLMIGAMTNPQSQATETNFENFAKKYIASNLFRRVIFFAFSKDKKMIQYPYTNNNEILIANKLTQLSMYFEEQILKSSKLKVKYQEFIENFYNIFNSVCNEMTSYYLRDEITDYLETVLKMVGNEITLGKWYGKWRASRFNFPISLEYQEWNNKIINYVKQEMSNISMSSSDPYSRQLQELSFLKKEAKVQFVDLFKQFYEFFLDIFSTEIDTSTQKTLSDHIIKNYSSYNAILDNMINYAQKTRKEHLQLMNQLGIHNIFENFLSNEASNITMYHKEERLFNDFLPKWEIWGKLEMNMFGENKYNLVGWFKKLLILVGELPNNIEENPDMFQLESIEIFKINNRRLII